MVAERIRRGIESYVAAFLKEYVAPALLERDEVRRGLGPEGLERVRREVLARLEEAERRGLDDREHVREVAAPWMAAVLSGPGGSLLLALLKSWMSGQPPEGRKPR